MGAVVGEMADGTIKEVEVIAYGALAAKDTAPLAVAALRGIFVRRIESVTYVNAHLTAKSKGIVVRESKSAEESNLFKDELAVIISSDKGTTTITGTILAHDEPIITRINEHPINLSPAKYMLFTTHKDQPGMVAKVAEHLVSTM